MPAPRHDPVLDFAYDQFHGIADHPDDDDAHDDHTHLQRLSRELPATRRSLSRARLVQLAIGFAVAAVALGLGGWVFSDWYVTIPKEAKAEYVGRNSCAFA